VAKSGSGQPRDDAAVPYGRKLNKLRNLALQGSVELSAPNVDSIPLSDYFVSFDGIAPLLRQNGTSDAEPLTPEALDALAKDRGAIPLDLVFADNSCIDLSFRLPDALLPELRHIIENEIQFRSPFNDSVSYSFWVGEEQTDGKWRARAAVVLKTKVDDAFALIAQHGFPMGVVRRYGKDSAFAALPVWAGYASEPKPRRIVSGLPSLLKLSLLGAVIFCASAIAATVSGNLTQSQVAQQADAARASLAAQAQAAAGIRTLDQSLANAADKLAMTGTLSSLLPDGVWLDQLSIDDDPLTIIGFGPSAADITRNLATLPQLSDIRFASPVTRDNTQSLERFRIVATLNDAEL
jgi:hypothetical protein